MRRSIIGGIIGVLVLAAAAALAVAGVNHSASAIKIVMGQRFFPNGTGLAYFDDGTMQRFFHTVTPRNGYYYDNSTVFLAGDIPGFNGGFVSNPSLLGADNNNNNSASSDNHTTVTIRIPDGFTLKPGEQKFRPNIVRAHPGDIVTWVNDDYQIHDIESPPPDPYDTTYFAGATLPRGQNFGALLQPGQTFSIIIPPIVGGGYHFKDPQFKNATGAIIVEKPE